MRPTPASGSRVVVVVGPGAVVVVLAVVLGDEELFEDVELALIASDATASAATRLMSR
jgi:ribosomal protein L18E